MLHDAMTERVLGAAMKSTPLGAGCLESTYDACIRYQLTKDGIAFEHPQSGGELLPLHLAQVLTYLKLSGHRVGLLINFNVPHLRDGIRRVMNGMERGGEPRSRV
jgi:hypothetical protein